MFRTLANLMAGCAFLEHLRACFNQRRISGGDFGGGFFNRGFGLGLGFWICGRLGCRFFRRAVIGQVIRRYVQHSGVHRDFDAFLAVFHTGGL